MKKMYSLGKRMPKEREEDIFLGALGSFFKKKNLRMSSSLGQLVHNIRSSSGEKRICGRKCVDNCFPVLLHIYIS